MYMKTSRTSEASEYLKSKKNILIVEQSTYFVKVGREAENKNLMSGNP